MPRNASGVYSLPDPPVLVGAVIDAVDENDCRNDLAAEITNSLDRNGRGGMLAPFKIFDGTIAAPGMAFTADTDNGMFRNSANDWSLVAGASEVARLTPNTFTIPATATLNVLGSLAIGSLSTNDISPAQLVANTNDWAPAGLVGASMIRYSTDASRNLTGLTGGSEGRLMFLHNVGAFNLVLKDEDVASAVANRFYLAGDYTLLPDSVALLQYDTTTLRWRQVGLWSTTYGQSLLGSIDASAAWGTLGFSAAVQSVLDDASIAAMRTTLDVPSKAEAILDSLIDAAGDLLVGTAADTVARLPIGTVRQVLRVNAAGTTAIWDSQITLAAEQASTSGTSIDFTGIPAGVRRITIMFVGLSTNGTSNALIQIGDAGGPETSGYLSSSSFVGGATSGVSVTTGFVINRVGDAAGLIHGAITLNLENAAGFTWVASGNFDLSGQGINIVTAGRKSLSAELDRVRITTVNGTDVFDAGAISISYE